MYVCVRVCVCVCLCVCVSGCREASGKLAGGTDRWRHCRDLLSVRNAHAQAGMYGLLLLGHTENPASSFFICFPILIVSHLFPSLSVVTLIVVIVC